MPFSSYSSCSIFCFSLSHSIILIFIFRIFRHRHVKLMSVWSINFFSLHRLMWIFLWKCSFECDKISMISEESIIIAHHLYHDGFKQFILQMRFFFGSRSLFLVHVVNMTVWWNEILHRTFELFSIKHVSLISSCSNERFIILWIFTFSRSGYWNWTEFPNK